MHSGNDMSISTRNFGNGVTKLLRLLIPVVTLLLAMLAPLVSEATTGNVDTEGTFLYSVFMKYEDNHQRHIVAKIWQVDSTSGKRIGNQVIAAGVQSPTEDGNENWEFLETSKGDDYYGIEVRPLMEEYGIVTEQNKGVINDVYDFLRYLDTLLVPKNGELAGFKNVYIRSLNDDAINPDKDWSSRAAFVWFAGNDHAALRERATVNSPAKNIDPGAFSPLRMHDINLIGSNYVIFREKYMAETPQADTDKEVGSVLPSNDNQSSFDGTKMKLLLSSFLGLILILLIAILAVYLNSRKQKKTIDILQRDIGHQERKYADLLRTMDKENDSIRSKLKALAGQPKDHIGADDDIKPTQKPSNRVWGGVKDNLDQAEAQKGWRDPGRSNQKVVHDNSLSLLKEELDSIGDRIKEYHSQHEDRVQGVEKKLDQFTLDTIEDFESVRSEVSEVLNRVDKLRENTLENFKKLKSFNKRVEIEQIDRIADIKQSNAQKSAFAGLLLDLFERWFNEHSQLGEILTDQAIEEIKSKLQHLQNETQVLTEQKRFAEALIGFCNQKARGNNYKAIIPKLMTVREQADGILLMINEGRWDSGHLKYLAQLGLDTDENATSPLNQFATALATFVLLAKDPEGWIKKQSSFLEESVAPQLILMTFGYTNESTRDSEGLVTILQGAGMEIIRPTKGSNFAEREHEVFGFIPGGESGKIARVERPGLLNAGGGVVLRAIVELFE